MLTQRNLSDEIADQIREMIFDGRLEADSRINEVHLAGDLGVSRTPVREALKSLVSEGALSSVPRRGFFVRPLTIEEAEEIYPIRAFLDPEALRYAGIPSPERLDQLERIRLRLDRVTAVKKAIALDEEWHRALWTPCSNRVLTGLIEQFMLRTRRYELASMSDPRNVRSSTRAKMQIEELLRANDLEGACVALRLSLLGGREPVLEWLRQRTANGK